MQGNCLHICCPLPLVRLPSFVFFCCLAVLAPSGPLSFISSSHQKWIKAGAWEGDKASSLSWPDLKRRINFPLKCLVVELFLCKRWHCSWIMLSMLNSLRCAVQTGGSNPPSISFSARWPISSRILTIKISRTFNHSWKPMMTLLEVMIR